MDSEIKGYSFEPEYTEEELEELEKERVSQASGNIVSTQLTQASPCRCDQCRFEIAVCREEMTCCHHSDLTASNLDETKQPKALHCGIFPSGL